MFDDISPEERQRYQRQMVLPEIGVEGQIRLKQANVLCVGVGGLGSSTLPYLVAAGVGTVGMIDMDVVDLTNLQRQVLYCESDSGRKKVVAAAERLQALNRYTKFKIYDEAFNAENAEKIMRNYDLVIDGADNFATKYLVNDAAVKRGIPYIYGAVLGFEGRVAVFWGKTGPCYRCLYPYPPSGYIPNCAEFGVLGALPGIIGCVQAMETIKWIVGGWSEKVQEKPSNGFKPLLNTLWTVDSCTMEVRTFTIRKNEQCLVCGQTPENVVLSDIQSELCISSSLKSLPTDAVFLDVRETTEWKTGYIPTAQHLPLSLLTQNSKLFSHLDQQKTYIVYCHSGQRSQVAVNYLKQHGFTDVRSLPGGISAWTGKIVTENDK